MERHRRDGDGTTEMLNTGEGRLLMEGFLHHWKKAAKTSRERRRCSDERHRYCGRSFRMRVLLFNVEHLSVTGRFRRLIDSLNGVEGQQKAGMDDATSLLVINTRHNSKSYCAMRITQAVRIGVARVCKEGGTIARASIVKARAAGAYRSESPSLITTTLIFSSLSGDTCIFVPPKCYSPDGNTLFSGKVGSSSFMHRWE
ncbi:hypothetical protein ARMSODRAFT_975197 [Armillaria solidipes]|uniref:Uncharacterized protein n=1 Tax=Armillaria solidipes TaxID=1076256 RepID=A0A2H3BF56_9AGAR|nr:hypothetical protein ARMSODRAFT_975197 [Armillaria solidipes]